MKEGKLIVFAGGEGCGKSTCIKNIQKMLPGEKFIFTREPGGTPSAEIIRDFFLKHELSAFEELLAVKLTRSIHFREKVLPALKSGKHVISDRCCETAWAYQVVARDEQKNLGDLFHILDKQARGGRCVDLWIDFQIDITTALARRMGDATNVNIIDTRPLAYHQKTREGLNDFFSTRKHKVFAVDATLSEQDLTQAVYTKLNDFLSLTTR